ncbi:MAG: HAMP domain-containing histidine kinase [Myxococcales bacterium]|jgi:signal transduction histidine kinase|nr:HAMP domain-containing histidine kinase [Myxococcales bacterium]
MRASLLTKLLVVYVLPMTALIALMLFFGWSTVRGLLNDELGKRLASHAAAAAISQRAELLAMLAPGDDGNRTHRNAVARLAALQGATDALERLYIFTPQHQLLASTAEGDGPIGTPMPELGRDVGEIDWALSHRQPIASHVTFKGKDGRLYKSGYAPILNDQGEAMALVGVDASAESFTVLDRALVQLALFSALVGLLGLVAVSLLADRWIGRPIRRLARAVARIGRGDLKTEVSSGNRDEIGSLALGMDRMRDRLLARERELQMMLSGIAHEVRNPLGGIALFTGLLNEELSADPEARAYIEKIQRELSHLERLVDDFLNSAREPRLEKLPIDLRSLFEALSELMAPELCVKRQTLDILVAPDVEALLADETLLRRALLNLLRNASQAAPVGGHIELKAARHARKFILSVRDDGPGIPPEVEAQMLTPFFTTKEKGIGLGLPLVARFATAHGGALRLLPSDKGTHFAMELPQASMPRGCSDGCRVDARPASDVSEEAGVAVD